MNEVIRATSEYLLAHLSHASRSYHLQSTQNPLRLILTHLHHSTISNIDRPSLCLSTRKELPCSYHALPTRSTRDTLGYTMFRANEGIQKILDIVERDHPETRETLVNLFNEANVTDILLPFPRSGLGLPSSIRDDAASLRNFIEAQTRVFPNYAVCPDNAVHDRKSQSRHYQVNSLDDVVDESEGYRNHYHLDSRGIMEKLNQDSDDEERIRSTYRGLGNMQHDSLEGTGGFGSVFRVKLRKQDLAMKLILRPRPQLPNDQPRKSSDAESLWPEMDHIGEPDQDGHRIGYPEKQQRSFEEEIHVLRIIRQLSPADKRLDSIRENHIVQIQAAFTDPQAFGIIISPVAFFNMEQLLDRISKGSSVHSDPDVTFEKGQLQKCLGCLAASVAFLHKSNIRHRDLKTKNVLIVPKTSSSNKADWQICLCDFATAVVAVKNGGPGDGADTERAAIHPKTPDYESPEKRLGLPRDMSEDMWHLGCIFLEIFLVIKGTTKERLKESLEEREARGDSELQLYGKASSQAAFKEWLDKLSSNPREPIDVVSTWIEDLLVSLSVGSCRKC